MKMLNEREIGRLKQRYTTDGKKGKKVKGPSRAIKAHRVRHG